MDLIDALTQARDMPDGEGKIAELERIVAHCDATADRRLGFDARCELIDAYHHLAQRWRIHPVFNWCLAACDRDPAMFGARDTQRLRRYHKLTVAALSGSPRVGLTQTRAALNDLERRLDEGGDSRHVIHQLRCQIADHLGDEPAARDWLARWGDAARDDNSDCAGCEPARQAALLASWGEWAQAVRVAGPALTGDGAVCVDQPERALVAMLLPYLHLGRFDEAAQAHVRAYRRHREEWNAFPFLAEHLRFCALSGHHERGLDILAEHLGRLDQPYDEASAMEFAAAGAQVCRLAGEAGTGERIFRRPAYGDRPAADVTVTALGADLVALAQDLAGQFDARNGTGHQSGRMAAWLAERPLCAPPDLPPDETDGPADGPTDEARTDAVVPLSLDAIVAVLDERGDRYLLEPDGTIGGRWGDAVVRFERLGEQREILHVRIVAERRLPASGQFEAYEFCNAWNHDRLMPKAFVHPTADGELILAADATTDLEHGVTREQLSVLINTALDTGVAFVAAVAALP